MDPYGCFSYEESIKLISNPTRNTMSFTHDLSATPLPAVNMVYIEKVLIYFLLHTFFNLPLSLSTKYFTLFRGNQTTLHKYAELVKELESRVSILKIASKIVSSEHGSLEEITFSIFNMHTHFSFAETKWQSARDGFSFKPNKCLSRQGPSGT